jgi:hypothetical protein
VLAVRWLWQTLPAGKGVRGLLLAVGMVFIGVSGYRALDTARSYHTDGRGYSGARDHISETYAYIRNRPEVPIYSNAPAGIYFWTGRMTQAIPALPGVQAMQADMKKRSALLVVFKSIETQLYGVSQEDLTRGLDVQIELSEATIYQAR